ncbi:hypothetical protein TCAL_16002, partial [Tigriopus californicus]
WLASCPGFDNILQFDYLIESSLDKPNHGFLKADWDDRTKVSHVGKSYSYKCRENEYIGYTRIDGGLIDRLIKCLPNKRNNTHTQIKCTPAKCEDDPSPTPFHAKHNWNTTVTGEGRYVSTTFQYVCEDNFRFPEKGLMNLTNLCKYDKASKKAFWEYFHGHPVPPCIPFCSETPPDGPKNGNVWRSNEYDYENTTLQYSCTEGYKFTDELALKVNATVNDTDDLLITQRTWKCIKNSAGSGGIWDDNEQPIPNKC